MDFNTHYFKESNNIKDILNSDKMYEILDSCKATYGTTPCAGGCAVIAFALNKYYNYPIYVLYNNKKNVVDHFVVKTNNDTYLDCDGEHQNIVQSFKSREGIKDNIVLLPYDVKMNIADMVIDNELINKILEYFKDEEI